MVEQPSRPAESTAAILLGSDKYPFYEELENGSTTFRTSSIDIKAYLEDSESGLGIAHENVLDLFADEGNHAHQLDTIRLFLRKVLKGAGDRIVNVIVHYVGHGILCYGHSECTYGLALRQTQKDSTWNTVLKASDLAHELRNEAAHSRCFVILDCCYAGEAARPFLGPEVMFFRKKIEESFGSSSTPDDSFDSPKKGCGLLCSSDRHTAALNGEPGEQYTKFSAALLHTLRNGKKNGFSLLTLNEIYDLTHDFLRKNSAYTPPFIISPAGDICRKVRLFPNAAERTQKATSTVRPVRIIHLSDLHFGAEGQEGIWRSLAAHIKVLKPDLILVSGNIVHSPERVHFQNAKEELNKLDADAYVVCAGDHDRHWYETTASAEAPAPFDEYFWYHTAGVNHPAVFHKPYKVGNTDWKIALITLDTSRNALSSKSGHVPSEDLKALEAAAAKVEEDTDLCIVLQHHCLLPSTSLESAYADANAIDANQECVQSTVMPNAGDLLKILAENNFNLVLHGHNHRHFVAQYTEVSSHPGDVTIVAAGSAIGASSDGRCYPKNASFNVIELREDRTVWLEEYRCEDMKWKRPALGLQLYTSGGLRKIRLKRVKNKGLVATPTSRMVKRFEFSCNRDIYVREVRTNWAIGPLTLSYEAFNSTGFPKCLGIKIDWADGSNAFSSTGEYVPSENEPHMYHLKLPLPNTEKKTARCVTVDTQWFSGGLLTANDFAMVRPLTDKFRIKDIEFAGATVTEALEALTIILSLPEGMTPRADELITFAVERNPEYVDIAFTSIPAWRRPLDLGNGNYLWTVPFPLVNMRYGIAWKPLKVELDDEASIAFREVAKSNGKDLLVAFMQCLPDELKTNASFALYLSNGEGTSRPHWTRKEVLTESSTLERPALALHVMIPKSIHRECWWGKTGMVQLPCDEGKDLVNGETAAIAIPIRPPGADLRLAPVAMVRIGYDKVTDFGNVEMRKLSLKEAEIMLLNEYIGIRGERNASSNQS